VTCFAGRKNKISHRDTEAREEKKGKERKKREEKRREEKREKQKSRSLATLGMTVS